jgi:hypothetical protein
VRSCWSLYFVLFCFYFCLARSTGKLGEEIRFLFLISSEATEQTDKIKMRAFPLFTLAQTIYSHSCSRSRTYSLTLSPPHTHSRPRINSAATLAGVLLSTLANLSEGELQQFVDCILAASFDVEPVVRRASIQSYATVMKSHPGLYALPIVRLASVRRRAAETCFPNAPPVVHSGSAPTGRQGQLTAAEPNVVLFVFQGLVERLADDGDWEVKNSVAELICATLTSFVFDQQSPLPPQLSQQQQQPGGGLLEAIGSSNFGAFLAGFHNEQHPLGPALLRLLHDESVTVAKR